MWRKCRKRSGGGTGKWVEKDQDSDNRVEKQTKEEVEKTMGEDQKVSGVERWPLRVDLGMGFEMDWGWVEGR